MRNTGLPNKACTGLSKRNGAKLRELSYNFPKLADWAVHGRPHCVAAVGAGIFKQGTILLHHPVCVDTRCLNYVLGLSLNARKIYFMLLCVLNFPTSVG